MLLTSADLRWRDNQPYADQFEDLYFTDQAGDGGIEEVRTFFIQPTRILERAQQQPWVSVGELGFGTGLNFAVLAHDLLQLPGARLHFVSVEAFPLKHSDWQRLAGLRPQLPMAQALAADPLPPLPGWHHRIFAQGRVRLSVFYGDALVGWQQWQAQTRAGFDAWLLDGFAPDRNPAMWEDKLLQTLAALSSHNTTLATFSAAGRVKRSLQQAGFAVHKSPRQPYKREALVGTIDGPLPQPQLPEQVHIAGAGIGGCTMARVLADMGISVTLYDPAGIAQMNNDHGASKISQAVMHARLLGHADADAQLRAHAFHFASHLVSKYAGFQASGAVQLQGPTMDAAKLARVCNTYAATETNQHWWIQALSADELKQFNLPVALGDALWFAKSGVLNIPAHCEDLTDHAAIKFVPQALSGVSDTPVVLCNGAYIRQDRDLTWLELSQVHGQLDHFSLNDAAVGPSVPVVGRGYCVPQPELQQLTLGATYEYAPWPQEQARQHNLELNQVALANAELQHIGSTRGTRTVSSDRTPVIGRLYENCWVATGFASMGTTMAAYAAAMISNQLAGWAPPCTPQITATLAAERFRSRQARRGLRQGSLQQPPE